MVYIQRWNNTRARARNVSMWCVRNQSLNRKVLELTLQSASTTFLLLRTNYEKCNGKWIACLAFHWNLVRTPTPFNSDWFSRPNLLRSLVSDDSSNFWSTWRRRSRCFSSKLVLGVKTSEPIRTQQQLLESDFAFASMHHADPSMIFCFGYSTLTDGYQRYRSFPPILSPSKVNSYGNDEYLYFSKLRSRFGKCNIIISSFFLSLMPEWNVFFFVHEIDRNKKVIPQKKLPHLPEKKKKTILGIHSWRSYSYI